MLHNTLECGGHGFFCELNGAHLGSLRLSDMMTVIKSAACRYRCNNSNYLDSKCFSLLKVGGRQTLSH